MRLSKLHDALHHGMLRTTESATSTIRASTYVRVPDVHKRNCNEAVGSKHLWVVQGAQDGRKPPSIALLISENGEAL
jgi:hypothetical protein